MGCERCACHGCRNRLRRRCDWPRLPRQAMAVRRYQDAFAGSDKRVDPTLGDVCRVVERHAELLTEFYDGDEQMAVHDLRKHIAWYLKGFPVGGSTRRAFMECENLEDVRREIGRLTRTFGSQSASPTSQGGACASPKRCICLTDGWNPGKPRTRSVRRCSGMTRWMPATKALTHVRRAVYK